MDKRISIQLHSINGTLWMVFAAILLATGVIAEREGLAAIGGLLIFVFLTGKLVLYYQGFPTSWTPPPVEPPPPPPLQSSPLDVD